MKRGSFVAAVFVALAVAALAAPGAQAQKYPTKPIRLIVPFAAGGGSSIMAHAIGLPASEALGQPVVVDNRPGAGGAIAADIAAHAAPDGYTFIIVSASYCATSAYRKLTYDPVNGITPIALLGTTGLLIVSNPSVPATNIKQLIAYARSHPGKLNYASVGPGSVTHLALEYFKLITHTNMVHVPYKGSAPALTAVVSGEVQVSALSMVPTIPHIRAGRLRALAITSGTRSPLLPNVPTVEETVPGFKVIHWYGMWGPKGIPRDIVMRWNHEVSKVLNTSLMQRQMKSEGLQPAGGPPEQLGNLIASDVKRWRTVMKKAGIRQVD